MIGKIIGTEHNVIWQTSNEDIAEPALLIENHDSYISIQQEERYISINKETLPELIKLLKSIK